MADLFTPARKSLVIFDGEETLILEARVERRIRTSEYISALQTTGTVETPLLPTGCKQYLSLRNGNRLYVVERPPVEMACTFQPIFNQLEGKEFKIWIPWQVYFIEVNREGFYRRHRWCWARTNIRSPETELFNAALPNEYSNGQSCMGGGTRFGEAGNDVERICQSVIGHYRSSSFNSDLDGDLAQIRAREIHSHPVPDEYEGITRDMMNGSRCTAYIYRLWHWSQTTLNPHIDVCQLSYLSRGAYSRTLNAMKEGNY